MSAPGIPTGNPTGKDLAIGEAATERPNIVLMIADDLDAGGLRLTHDALIAVQKGDVA